MGCTHRAYECQKLDVSSSPVYSEACKIAGQGSAILAEAIIVACRTPGATIAQKKQKLSSTIAKLDTQSATFKLDMTGLVHSILLSKASRFLRENV